MAEACPYDALLVLSFGGPEGSEDVIPFLENVTRGRDIPRERLEEVATHYHAFGGRSPINDQNRALVAALDERLATRRISVPVYWGNRNWYPHLADELELMRRNGVERAAVFVTSAYSSYSGCRQYREDMADAVAVVGTDSPRLDRLRHCFDHPGFVEANVDGVVGALGDLPAGVADQAHLVFVTHSIPDQMAAASGPDGDAYVAQHEAVASGVADGVAQRTGTDRPYELVYCSRSESPQTPWLEPDVNTHLSDLAARGARGAVLVPIGFVSDHMEVVFDLDTEATGTAQGLDLPVVRAATAGTHPAFVDAIVDLVVERAAVERGEPVDRVSLGAPGPFPDVCAAGCCGRPGSTRFALCGVDSPTYADIVGARSGEQP